MGLFRRRSRPLSIESEQERLHAIRIAAEQELGRLRRELTERVAIVERRERELADAIDRVRQGAYAEGSSGGDDEAVKRAHVSLVARARELERRERQLAGRERARLVAEAELAERAIAQAATPEERAAQIDARLAALEEAEKAFARTQVELAARSEELAIREAELAEKERAYGGGGAAGVGLSRAELEELDERLRRLESKTREAASSGGFDEELRSLERRGLRG